MGNVAGLKQAMDLANKEYEPEFIKALKDQKFSVVSNVKGDSGYIKFYNGAVKLPFSIVADKLTFTMPRVNFEDPKTASKFIADFLKVMDANGGDFER